MRVVPPNLPNQLGFLAAAITPVPGGVGPMTIAAVLNNTIQAARMHAGLKEEDTSCHYASDSA